MPNKQLKTLEGYLINCKPYKESDTILTILTNKGLKTIFGRSYRSPKSKYHVLNNLFLKVKIIGEDAKNFKLKDYDILDYSLVNNFTYDEVKKLSKIINLIKVNEKNNEKIYQYFDYILQNIQDDKNNNYLTWFIVKLLEENQINIEFKKCINCGKKEDIITLSLYSGGLICKNCLNHEKIKKIEEIKQINLIFNGKIKDVEKMLIKQNIKIEIEELLNESLGLYIKE
ncbi:MAG: DNA repair protein RecO [Mycoplasmatales bacterium]